MLDIAIFREKPEVVRKDLERRGELEKLKDVERVIDRDEQWRSMRQRIQEIQRSKNEVAKTIATKKKAGEDTELEIKELKDLSARLEKEEATLETIRVEIDELLMSFPNILHDSVPRGKDETENEIVRTWGQPPAFPFEARGHNELLEILDVADVETAGRVAGARFYYLKNELVELDLALQNYALDVLKGRNFILVQPPPMMRQKPVEGVTDWTAFHDVLYKIEGEDLYLIATSEHPLAAMQMDQVIDEECMPYRVAGLSPCFRKEAGTHGKDEKGIFRVHNFTKVEQFVFSKPEESWGLHEELLEIAEEIYQHLGLPYRVVNVCTGDIGSVAAKKYDVEVWMPAQDQYREAVSCSNCTDYQARRLNIRYGKHGGVKELVHTLNSTAIANTRTMVAILENFQNEDGSVDIPKALHKYTGFKRIEPV